MLRGKWRLDVLLGVGGTAAVYAATHRNLKRVAIKILHPELSPDREACLRFVREGYAANRIGHPGAVSVIDDDATDDGAAFLVMELLDGETFDARWQRSGQLLPAVEVLAMVDPVLDVLVAAHAHGIVHRDLKPENMFLTRERTVKVLDFGWPGLREAVALAADHWLARRGDGHPTVHAAGAGTWRRRRHRRAYRHLGARRVDVHADERPLRARRPTVPQILIAAATQRAPPLRQVAPHVPAAVAELVESCLGAGAGASLARRGDHAAGLALRISAAHRHARDQ